METNCSKRKSLRIRASIGQKPRTDHSQFSTDNLISRIENGPMVNLMIALLVMTTLIIPSSVGGNRVSISQTKYDLPDGPDYAPDTYEGRPKAYTSQLKIEMDGKVQVVGIDSDVPTLSQYMKTTNSNIYKRSISERNQ